MALEDLVGIKKISPEEAAIYNLFAVSELGRNWFVRMLEATFMDTAPPMEMRGEVLAYLEGRRSILREIKMHVSKIDKLLAEEHYD